MPAGMSCASGLLEVVQRFPKTLLFLYWVNAFLESFPMLALVDWLNNYLAMPLSTQAQFYAFVFIPFYFKPLYALLANYIGAQGRFSGRSRAIVLQACGLLAAVGFLTIPLIDTIAGAFAVYFFISGFNACAELMLGSYLMDAAHKDMSDAGAVQAVAGGARAFGSISASLVCLGIYPCSSAEDAPNSRLVLAFSSLIALCNFIFAFWLPSIESETFSPGFGQIPSTDVADSAAEVPSASWGQQEGGDSRDIERKLPGQSRTWLLRGFLSICIMFLFQSILTWISVKELVGSTEFWGTLIGLLTALVLAGVITAAAIRRSSQNSLQFFFKHGAPALFLFLYNAAPSAGYEIYTFQFYLFYAEAPCKMTYLSLISSSASVLAYGLYALTLNRRGIRLAIVLTAALGISIGLLWLPFASLDFEDGSADPAAGACVDISFVPEALMPSCFSPFAYAAAMQFISGISGALALTPSTVLATESSPHEHRTTAYAIYLSLIDSGESASGWITSAIVTRLGLSYDNWAPLPDLIWIGACSQLAVLALVPFLRDTEKTVAHPVASSREAEVLNCLRDDSQLSEPLTD